MAMSPHQLVMLMLEKPQALAQLAAAKGIEPPETPEEAVEKLKDPSLSPADRERLQGIAAGLKSEESDYSTTVPEALGQAGSALMQFAPNTSVQPTESGRLEQNQLRQRGTDALAGTATTPTTSQERKGFDPDAPQAPAIPAAQGPSAPSAQQPQVAPLTQQLQQPTPQPTVVINTGPQPGAGFQPPTNFQTQASMTPTPVMPQAAAAPAAPAIDPWAAALAGIGQPSTPGAGGGARGPAAVAPYNPGALQPQTLAIIQALAAQQQRAPNLASLLGGGQ